MGHRLECTGKAQHTDVSGHLRNQDNDTGSRHLKVSSRHRRCGDVDGSSHSVSWTAGEMIGSSTDLGVGVGEHINFIVLYGNKYMSISSPIFIQPKLHKYGQIQC